ncbi:MAG: hypothetical protein ACI4IF_04200 [Acutalibacteraceae bacterium]
MANYTGSAAYDLSLFEPQVIEKPKTKNNTKKTPPEKQVAKKSASNEIQTNTARKAQNVKINVAIIKTMAVACVFCMALVGILVMNSKINALDRQIANVENELSIAEGESVRLNAELSSKISTDKIEDYAENVLGMVKAENYQISYIDLSKGDQIVVSGDKTVNDGSEFSNKIKELVAYIF